MAEKNVVTGANVGFKVGTQAAVDTILTAGSGAIHGCFYLTKDSHRLYIGNEDTSLSPVNEGIEYVALWSDLQNIASTAAGNHNMSSLTGRFYYVGDRNILCVYNGSSWVQLNENTNTTIKTVTDAVTASSNTATVTTTIEDTDDEYSASFTITGDNGIIVTGSGTAITLAGDTYTLSSTTVSGASDQVNIHLESTNTNNDSDVKLVGGTNVGITQSSNTITFTADDTTNASMNISSDATGFTVTVIDSEGDDVSASVDPKVAWYTDSSSSGTTTNTVSFVNGTATLDVYSRSAIDAKLQAANAMTYKGTITSAQISYNETTEVTTIMVNGSAITPSIGDVYLITTAGTYNGVAYKENSLLIVKAKSGVTETNGVLPANGYDCDIVAELYVNDTTYIFEATTGGILLRDSVGDPKGSLVISSGDNYVNITESSSGNATDGYDKVLTLTHSDVTRTNTTNTNVTQGEVSSVTIPVVTAITSDSKGHVTGVTSGSYTLTDTNASLTNVANTTSAYTNSSYSAGVINTAVTLTQSDTTVQTQTDNFVIRSTTLNITDNDTTPTTSGGSTTAAGIQVELLWGSF